jgi:Trk K+ transport system NAD-binding subunit
VRPEFQELFRTTTNRLVTEAHKDFCANTAFRWDIYARTPRAIPEVADRLRAADDLHFRVTRPGTTLPYQANLGVVTSTVQGPLYQALLDVLGTGSLRLSEILADSRLAGTPPAELARAVDAGVAMGLFDVSAGPTRATAGPVAGGITIPSAFNRMVLANDAIAGRVVTLASTASGTGHTIGTLDAAILHELVAGGPDGLADRIDARLTAAGREVQKEGKTITDPTERLALVRFACDTFRTTSLPQLAQLGIIAPA